MLHLLYKISFIIFFNIFIFFSHSSLIIAAPQQSHPLRPFPFDLTSEEQGREKESPEMTLYCAQRPTAIQTQEIDIRNEKITIEVKGALTSNLEQFITPLLSITDTNKTDFDLSFEEKAQQYLADYLGGRAYYETFAESAESQEFFEELELSQVLTDEEISLIKTYGLDNIPDENQKQLIKIKINSNFLISRLGPFRKLAPKTYQDKLKRAIIQRATNTFTDNLYSFSPASQSIHNYTVAYWDNAENKVVDYKQGQEITLKDFVNNWAPLPEKFTDFNQYQSSYTAWEIKDGGHIEEICDSSSIDSPSICQQIIHPGKWAQLWPYVPMFSREDTKGYVVSITEPDQTNQDGDIQDVTHPNLARTYELTSALHNLLTPQKTHSYNYNLSPKLESQWNNDPWTDMSQWPENENIEWWFKSDKNKSEWTNPETHGPVCDPINNTIYSSGDLAQDSQFTTTTNYTTGEINNPFYDENTFTTNDCNQTHHECETWSSTTHPETGITICNLEDESTCIVNKDARANPNYLLTYTPFLNNIMNRLVSGPTPLFNIFKTADEIKNEPPENWPAVGTGSANLAYSFDAGSAQAGFKKSANPAQFYYKYLGWIHCQKQKLITKLQPSAGKEYDLSPECGGEGGGDGGGTVPDGLCTGEAFSKLGGIPSQTSSKAKSFFDVYIASRLTPEVVNVYVEAEKQTGVPCEVLAGIHFREGGNNPNQSLVSGRPLGTPEPDAGGKVFTTLLETAIYAGNALKGKTGGSIPNIETLAKALSRYNGGGNSNCNSQYSCSYAKTNNDTCPFENCCNLSCRETCAQNYNKTIYDFVYPYTVPSFCPTSFEGQDDPYSMAWYDNSHLDMYLLYCLDRTMCTPQEYNSPGTLVVALDYYLSHKQ